MKKIIIAMAAIAAAFTMASCSKDQPVSPNENPTVGKSVITASIENDLTKTTLEGNDDEGYKVFWSAGDNLFVCDEGGSRDMNWVAEYKLDDSSVGSPKGTFIWHTGDYFIPVNKSYQEPLIENGNVYVATHPFDLMDLDNFRLIWKTEQTYSTTDRYIPMYAVAECTKDGEADFKFTNLGGMLRLTVKGSAYIRSIKISAAENEAMSGSFLVDEDDNGNMVGKIGNGAGDVENYIILDCGANGVRLSEEGTDFYISMPCHYIIDEEIMKWVLEGYSDVTITLTDTDGKTCVKKLNNKKLVIERSKITTASFTASEFKANTPDGALSGKFSVSATKKVHFSKGNLYYDGSAFKFEANQYEIQTGWSTSHVSHFFWSKDSNEAIIENYNEDQAVSDEDVFFTNADDFTVNVGGKEQGGWRTLSTEEWQYLFNTRSGTLYKCGVTVCSKTNCVVLLPDDWVWDASTVGTDWQDGGYPETSTEKVTWKTMEDAGAVCLPAAGGRDGSDVSSVGFYGFYWSSSAYGSLNACIVLFFGDSVYPGYFDYRDYGFSVRLITESK